MKNSKNIKIIISIIILIIIAIAVVFILKNISNNNSTNETNSVNENAINENIINEEVINIESTTADYGAANVYAKDENGDIIAGAKFSLVKKETGEVITKEDVESGLDGKVRFVNVPVGEYEIIAKEAPKGYEKKKKKIDLVINKAQDTNADLIFNRVRATIVVETKDEEENFIQGAKFVLYNDEGEDIQHITSDSEGYCGVRDLPLGKYYIEVESLPEGYTTNMDRTEINLENEDQVLLFKVTLNKQ